MDSKSIWKSKTFYGCLIAAVLAVLGIIDKYFGTDLMSGEIVNLVIALASMFGVYGRMKASTKVTIGKITLATDD